MQNIDSSDLRIGPKDLPYQRRALGEPPGDPILTPEQHQRLISSLHASRASADSDSALCDRVDESIRRYRKLPDKRNAYPKSPDQRDDLTSVADIVVALRTKVSALDETGRRRFYRALGKDLAPPKDGAARRKAGEKRFNRYTDRLQNAAQTALARTKDLPKGNRELEDETWLVREAAKMLWEVKGIPFSNSSSKALTSRSDPRPRDFIEQVLQIAIGRRVSERQLNTLMRKVVRERKERRLQSDDSEASDSDV